MEPEVRYCTTTDGMRIAYAVTGEGPVFVSLIDSLVSHVALEWSNEVNRRMLEEEARHFKLVRMDVRGSGLSTRVSIGSVDELVLDIEAVVDRLGLDRFVLHANTSLSQAAIRFAARHGDRVSKLLLIDGFARRSEVDRASQVAALNAAAASDWEVATESIGAMVFGPGRQENLSHGAYIRACMNQADYIAGVRNLAEVDVSADAATLTMPVLVVRHLGFRWLSDEVTHDLVSLIPDARLVTINGTWIDDIEGLTRRIVDFVYEGEEGAPRAMSTGSTSSVRTVLFTDIVGHTEMMSRLGDARGREVLREHERITRETLKAHGGAEVKTMGDGFMASFGSVTAAVECAIDLQRALTRGPSPTGGEGSAIEGVSIRVGLNAGEPIEEDGDLFGATVILASRICAMAGAGEILVPETVRGLLAGKGFVFGDRGEFVPKGFDEGVRVWEVVWRGVARVRSC